MQEPLFAARVVYDLLFFFIVIIIVLNLIFGVIIDTFADLRSEKQRKEEILKTTCFICGVYSYVVQTNYEVTLHLQEWILNIFNMLQGWKGTNLTTRLCHLRST